MAKMNERQQEAVDCLDGALLLLAGAGTGKTTVIVHRIANLVMHQVSPSSILAVTFTNKAAREMRERIGAMLGPGISMHSARPFFGSTSRNWATAGTFRLRGRATNKVSSTKS